MPWAEVSLQEATTSVLLLPDPFPGKGLKLDLVARGRHGRGTEPGLHYLGDALKGS